MSPADEIRELYENTPRRIGEILVLQKVRLPYGEFVEWVKTSLPFSVRSAERYMRRYPQSVTETDTTILS